MDDVGYALPEPCGLSMSQIAGLAGQFSSIVGYMPGQPLDKVVEKLGGDLVTQEFWELDNSDSGSIKIRDKKDFDIYVAMHTSRERDRFTIAHELGHYVLHYLLAKERKPIKASRYGNSQTEREANWFAASLLMPEADFRAYHAECDGSLVALAGRYVVSISAARARAGALRLAVR